MTSPSLLNPPDAVHLRLLQTTDLHAQLCSTGPGSASLMALVPLIEAQRQGPDLTLLLDCGDFLQGNPLFDGTLPPADPADATVFSLGALPVIGAFNRLGYDAVALGNHEFAFGAGPLGTALQQADFPVISTNFRRHPGHDTALPQVLPHVILTRHLRLGDTSLPLRIGLVAATPANTLASEDPALSDQFHFAAMTPSIARTEPLLRAQGADLVLLLSHSGLSEQSCDPLNDNCAHRMSQIPGIDAMLCGHQHGLFPSDQFAAIPNADLQAGTVNAVPTVMAGAFGSHLGQIDLYLTQGASGWQVIRHAVQLHPAPSQPAPSKPTPSKPTPSKPASGKPLTDTALHAALAPYIQRAEARLDQPLGHSAQPLHSYFAQLAPCAVARTLAALQQQAIAPLLANHPACGLPVLSATVVHKSGPLCPQNPYVELPAGPLRHRDLLALQPFNTHLLVLRLTGHELQLWQQHNAQMFAPRHSDAQDQPLLNPRFPSYRFDHLFGVETRFDRTTPNALPALYLNGTSLRPDQEVVVITNTHRASTLPVLTALPAARQLLPIGPDLRQLLQQALNTGPLRIPPRRDSWLFTPLPGATATAEVATTALPHLQDIAHLRPEVLEQTSDTSTRLRLHL